MPSPRTLLASAAALGLLVSQTAYAAPAPRIAADSEEADGLTGSLGPVLAVLAVFIAVGLVILVTDDDEDLPTSP